MCSTYIKTEVMTIKFRSKNRKLLNLNFINNNCITNESSKDKSYTYRRPPKQFITEEKMTQHFRALHISANALNAQEPGPSTSTASCSSNLSNDVDLHLPNSLDTDDNNTQPRLVISDEVKRLQQEPILPTSLLSKL